MSQRHNCSRMTARAIRSTPVIEGVDDGLTVFDWVVVLSFGFAGQAVSDPSQSRSSRARSDASRRCGTCVRRRAAAGLHADPEDEVTSFAAIAGRELARLTVECASLLILDGIRTGAAQGKRIVARLHVTAARSPRDSVFG